MRWEQTTLPTKAEPGYGERELSAEDFVLQNPRPTVVWFFSVEDERENQSCETTVFQNEQVGLSLRRFRLVKIDVESIQDGKFRQRYARTTPSFHFIDPSGKTVTKIEGKQATSLSRFSGTLKQTWATMFAMNQRTFVKAMTKILDRLDRVTAQRTVLEAKKRRLQDKPNRAKSAAIAADEAELVKVEEKIQEDEQAVIDRCVLRKEFRTEKDAVAAR